MTDAERFLAGDDPTKLTAGTSPSYKFYAVRNGRVPGIYTDWPSAQKQVTGWTKPKHKCFSTRAEAQRFLEGDSTVADDTNVRDLAGDAHATEPLDSSLQPAAKKAKKGGGTSNGTGKAMKQVLEEYNPDLFDPGMGPLPPFSEDGFDPNIFLQPDSGSLVYKTPAQKQATKLQAVGPTPDSILRIFTDGSSLRNGQVGAFAGVGVYFGPADGRQGSPKERFDVQLTSAHQEHIRSSPRRSPNQPTRRADRHPQSSGHRAQRSRCDDRDRQPLRHRMRDDVVCELAEEWVEDIGGQSGREQGSG